jgi:putative ABC transport system permease protein
VLGLAGAYLAATALSTMFFGVRPVDPVVYGSVTGILAAVAFAANLIPALRASRMSPMRSLRDE